MFYFGSSCIPTLFTGAYWRKHVLFDKGKITRSKPHIT